MIAGFLRGAADFWDAVQAARAEQRTGFSEREAGDYLDTAGADAEFMDLDVFLDTASDDELAAMADQHVVDAEVHCEGCACPAICGCGREIYSKPRCTDGPLFWFHRDDHSPITLQCARIPLAEPTAEELAEAAAQREVSQEDLAAHVAGSIRHFRTYRAGNFEDAAGDIATNLLSEYRVTKR